MDIEQQSINGVESVTLTIDSDQKVVIPERSGSYIEIVDFSISQFDSGPAQVALETGTSTDDVVIYGSSFEETEFVQETEPQFPLVREVAATTTGQTHFSVSYRRVGGSDI